MNQPARLSIRPAHLLVLLVYLLVLFLAAGLESTVHAFLSNLYVATTGDDSNTCLSPVTPCRTVHGAVGKASPGGTIIVAAGFYTENLTLHTSLTISGAGALSTTIDGQALGSVFQIPTATITLKGMTIQNASSSALSNYGNLVISNSILFSNTNPSADGGALYNGSGATATLQSVTVMSNTTLGGSGGGALSNAGVMTLLGVTFISNSAPIATGGAMRNDGILTITDSVFNSNSAQNGGGLSNDGTAFLKNVLFEHNSGGGIIAFSTSNLTLDGVTLNANSTGGDGGGIAASGLITITNSTFSENSAYDGGGLLVNSGTATLTNVTLSANHALTGYGGGICACNGASPANLFNVTLSDNTAPANQGGGLAGEFGGTLNLKNTIVASSGVGGDCVGSFTSLGHNLNSDATCMALIATGDLTNTNPRLGPLFLNAPGATLTRALLPRSPAIDAGDNNGCPPTDQRGVLRPQGAACDIGAYEFFPILYIPIVFRP